MTTRFLFCLSFVCVFSIAGCAQPKYETVTANNTGQSNTGQQTEPPTGQTACALNFKKSGYCISWAWETPPSSSSAGSFVFKVFYPNAYDGSRVYVDTQPQPIVILWMPSMGHGGPPTTVTRLDVGTYRVSNIFFVMPGEWQMKFQLKVDGNVQDEAIATINI